MRKAQDPVGHANSEPQPRKDNKDTKSHTKFRLYIADKAKYF